MKRIVLPLSAMLLAAATTSIAREPEAPVAVDVRGLPIYLQEKIRAEAAKGVRPLRQYLDRTYAVHQLRVDAVIAKDEYAAQLAREASGAQVARSEARPRK